MSISDKRSRSATGYVVPVRGFLFGHVPDVRLKFLVSNCLSGVLEN